jgi:YidC/Oxa1 family membrane protein insertase
LNFWDIIAIGPMINVLLVLSHYLFHSFGLAIIALTIAVNAVLYPLTMRQIRSTQAMQSLQPRLAELQKKYARDRQTLAQEQMRLYRESGMSPVGCLVPMIIQLPVWIALFQAIMRLVAVIPENFLGLSQYLYSWPIVYTTLPLQNSFLGLNLAQGNLIMAVLVGGSMWLQQKMTTPPSADPNMQMQSRMMLWMMPLMFAFISLSFPSGLALYWITSSVIRVGMQYYVVGWGGLFSPRTGKQPERDKKLKKRIALAGTPSKGAEATAEAVPAEPPQETATGVEKTEDKPREEGKSRPAPYKQLRQPRRSKHPRKN